MSADRACEAQAAEWIARRDAGLDEDGRRQLARWLEADPAHQTAFEEVAAAWSALDRPRQLGLTAAIELGLKRRTRRRRRGRAAFGIGLAATLLVAGVFWQRPVASSPPVAGATATTTSQTLPDGSRAELNRGAEIRADFAGAERRVRLLRGETHFEVRPDKAHPFVVEVGGVEVRAVGTAFAVHYSGGRIEVLVTEGRVALNRTADAAGSPREGAPGPLLLSVGQRVTLSAQPVTVATDVHEMTEEDYVGRLGWRHSCLEFSGTPLAEVVKAFNLRNRQKLVIDDRTLEPLQISGIFRGDNVGGFTRLLEGSFGVRPNQDGEWVILLRRAP